MVGYGVAALGVVAVLALVAGTSYQDLANRRDLNTHPAPGQLVDIGGHRLHLWCTGEGSPVVVLEAGAGGSSLQWNRVQPEVARTTRVCAYDRGGLGWSDLGPTPRSAARIIDELHILLATAGVSGPYILTGHSAGGLYMRLYASTYPTDVAGMVLVEAAHEDQSRRMPTAAGAGAVNPLVLHFRSFLTVVGFARLTGIRFAGRPGFSPDARALSDGIRVKTTWPFAYASEALAAEDSAAQVRQARSSRWSMPLVVLTRGRFDGIRRLSSEQQTRIRNAWEEMQADLVTLSTRGAHEVASESDHYVHLDQPETVVDAIVAVVAEARADRAAR